MNVLRSLLDHGQSIWYDFISRDFIASGGMRRLVELGVRGMTSNPTIFEGALASGDSYDDQIRRLDAEGLDTREIATRLFITDIRDACDVMRPVYDSSSGADGFISLEVNPKFAARTDKTIAEAERLWRDVDRPNLMIKIPATDQGYPAIRHCIGAGINVNITLMFSVDQYRRVVDAYMSGLEDHLGRGEAIDAIASVASVFVSRIDSMVDKKLETIGTPEALALRGKAAVANARLTYQEFKSVCASDRWHALESAGARRQRPLWASTSTKNPEYPDLLYVDTLIGPDTVNTVPPATLEAILDHATVADTLERDIEEAHETMVKIGQAGVDVDAVMLALLEEGVEKFEKSFDGLFEQLEAKRKQAA